MDQSQRQSIMSKSVKGKKEKFNKLIELEEPNGEKSICVKWIEAITDYANKKNKISLLYMD